MPNEVVFVPNQAHPEDVEKRKDDQSGTMDIRESVYLVDDKEPQGMPRTYS